MGGGSSPNNLKTKINLLHNGNYMKKLFSFSALGHTGGTIYRYLEMEQLQPRVNGHKVLLVPSNFKEKSITYF